MKILGYDIKPMHVLYAGALTLAVAASGCGGSNEINISEVGDKMDYKMTSEAKRALNNYMFHKRQHSKMQYQSQVVSTILMNASLTDGDPADKIGIQDLLPILKNQAKKSAETYKDEIPGIEDIAREIME